MSKIKLANVDEYINAAPPSAQEKLREIRSTLFPFERPLPTALIKRIAEYRMKDVKENDAKWMY